MRRKADCNPSTQAQERTFYAYDGAHNRSSEDRQRWTRSAWVSDSKTEYLYTCHLDKTTQGKGSTTESVTEYCYDDRATQATFSDGTPAGNDLQESGPTGQLDFSYDAANRLIRMAEETTRSSTSLTYDGRNFLVQARQDVNTCSPLATQSTYSSDGVLLRAAPSAKAMLPEPTVPWAAGVIMLLLATYFTLRAPREVR